MLNKCRLQVGLTCHKMKEKLNVKNSPLNYMKTKIFKNLIIGLAGIGLLLCGNARGAIALQDGGLMYTISTTNGVSTITTNFTVTAGASVLVVQLWDFNHQANSSSPSTMTWSNTTLNSTQTLTRAVSQNCEGYNYSDSDIYYLYNPSVGSGVVYGTDTNAAAELGGMEMQVFDLSGVNTSNPPLTNGTGNGAALSLSVQITNITSGSWAAMIGYDANTGHPLTNTATTGTSSYFDVINYFIDYPTGNSTVSSMGYVATLAAGSTTFTVADGNNPSATLMAMATAVFAPIIGTASPINLVATGQTNQIKLTWTDNSGGAATNYIVFRSLTSGSGYIAIATNSPNSATSFTDTGVANYSTNYYVVQAVGPGGTSPNSVEVNAFSVGVPGIPAGFTATAGSSLVSLVWNVQNGANHFNVLRSTNGSSYASIGTSTSTNFTDSIVVDGTLYYYELDATNSFGTGAVTPAVEAIPAVTFFTNWIGLFTNGTSYATWVNGGGNADSQFFADAPVGGPSTSCLLFDANCGPAGSNDNQTLATNFPAAVNFSTYPNYEFDVNNEGGIYDQYGQIQAIRATLQAPTYIYAPDIVLFAAVSGSVWTHYKIPMSSIAGANVAAVTAVALNIFDENFTNAAEIDVGFANIEIDGAPGYLPVISGVTSQVIASNATSVTLTGTVSANIGGTNLYLVSGTPVTVTINGNAQATTIDDGTGDFSINYNTTGFATNTYVVHYTSASDLVYFVAATNTSTTLQVGGVAPAPSPHISQPFISGGNLEVSLTNTVAGHTYYLLSTTNLKPPITWTTNTSTAGTGGAITNPVPLAGGALFLEYSVH
jgi:hypothetical protein